MSSKTVAWAKEQRCGDFYAKAVLLELADWADRDGVCKYRRVKDLAEVLEMSERSVQRAIAKLELPTEDGGIGLIRRVARRTPNGGQMANCFKLIGFINNTDDGPEEGVSNSHPPRRPLDTHPQTNGHPPGAQQSPRNLEIDLELDHTPPPPPAGGRRERVQIPDDWIVPGVGDLPDPIRALAVRWPAEAYAAEAAAFHQHWRGSGRKQADWAARWSSRVQARHGEVMRLVERGAFDCTIRPRGSDAEEAEAANRHERQQRQLRAKRDECQRSAALHAAIGEVIGRSAWQRWWEPCALVFSDSRLTVIAPGEFTLSAIKTEQRGVMNSALAALGWQLEGIKYRISALGRQGEEVSEA